MSKSDEKNPELRVVDKPPSPFAIPHSSKNIREIIHYLINSKSYTSAEVAKAINLSASALSSYLSGKYRASTTKIDRALTFWLRKIGEGAGDDAYPMRYIETPATRSVVEACTLANEEGVIMVIIGKPGTGKTMGLLAWQERARIDGIRFIQVSCNICTTHVALLKQIAVQMKISTHTAAAVILEQITEGIKSDPRLIIIDESQHLGLKALEAVRAIHDETRTGIALLGSEALYKTMLHGDKTHIELQQLQDRVHRLELLKVLPQNEFGRFCSTWWGGAPMAQEVVALLRHYSNGFPRRVVRLMTHMREMCDETTWAPTVDMVHEAAKVIFRKEQL